MEIRTFHKPRARSNEMQISVHSWLFVTFYAFYKYSEGVLREFL